MSNVPYPAHYKRCEKCGHHIDPQYGCACLAEPKNPHEHSYECIDASGRCMVTGDV